MRVETVAEHDEGIAIRGRRGISPEPVRLVAEQVAVELGISKTAASYRVAFATALARFPATAPRCRAVGWTGKGRCDR